jgi:hypothetical protein
MTEKIANTREKMFFGVVIRAKKNSGRISKELEQNSVHGNKE